MIFYPVGITELYLAKPKMRKLFNRHSLIAVPFRKGVPVFHANNDSSRVREAVFKLIGNLPFDSQFIVARKIERVFTKRFDGDENKFYLLIT